MRCVCLLVRWPIIFRMEISWKFLINSVANALATLLISFFLLFAGYFIKLSNIVVYWRWVHYISFFVRFFKISKM